MTDLAKLPAVDPDTPNAARMYDYHLGGSHNFAADRAAGDRAREAMPWIREAVRANRSFLGRAVRYCQSQGIDQFLDLGSGIPTVGNVHEVAQATDPTARVSYVDNELVTVTSSAAMLADDPLSTITAADMRDPESVFAAPGVRDHLDLSRPVALLTVAVLHFLHDEDELSRLVVDYRSRLVPGSVHVLSHVTADFDPSTASAATGVYQQTANPILPRPVSRIAELLHGTELVEPGLVDASRWRPDGAAGPEHVGFVAGVGILR
ncbi:SAM-dependent methyltransferase [Pseudonocardia sp. GCM10023141]|uniref:SAM-dependent methyltransferase n=1 Tax=Pseudonocardia sp. GCM10023141 TaxID=3252653 RepID=UPI003615B1C3